LKLDMSTVVEKAAGPATFHIAAADLGPLLADQLGLRPNASSPLAQPLSGYVAKSAVVSEAAGATASRPLFARAARVLEAPDLRIAQRFGGLSPSVNLLDVYRCAKVEPDLLVAVQAAADGSLGLLAFESADSYLSWWLETFAVAAAAETPNYLPPPLTLEATLYLLHAVDCYRRAYYQSMLDYTTTGDLMVSAHDFFRTMLSSARSGDARWLAPAFLASTPGLPRLNPTDSDFEPLWGLDFLVPGKLPATGEDAFLWGEAGTNMGQEFLLSWGSFAGWEATLLPTGQKSLHRAFLASTSLTNHLFVVEEGADGTTTVNHQAMTLGRLRTRLEALLRQALETVPEVSSSAFPDTVPEPLVAPAQPVVPQVAPAAPTMPQQAPKVAIRFCTRCGAQMVEGDRFCGDCGAVAKA
jgi:hypothetical protein